MLRIDPGAGVFETLLVVDGVPLELEWHVERLAASVRALYGRTWTLPELPAADPGRFRLRITVRAEGTRVEQMPIDGASELGLAPPTRLAPVDAPSGLGPHKWRDRRWLEEQAAAHEGEPLLVDAGTVLEAGRGNVFLVEDGRLVTPPLDGRILPGVTRRRLLALAPVSEEPVTMERLLAAGEVFLTGSIRGVEPVSTCAARSWTTWPVAERLGRELRLAWRGAR